MAVRLVPFAGFVLGLATVAGCAPVQQAQPSERALAKRHEGRPFALVSVNVEPGTREDFAKVWKDLGNPWRCVWDGQIDGPKALITMNKVEIKDGKEVWTKPDSVTITVPAALPAAAD